MSKNRKSHQKSYILSVLLLLSCFSLMIHCRLRAEPLNLPTFSITLIGTNDIHGAAYPTILARKDTGEKYQYGGLIYMARIVEILKEQSDGNFLYLDAGDQFQGGLEASKTISSGEIISDYFNHMETNAGAVGNHEFDFGPEFLDQYLERLQGDIISANLVDLQISQDYLPLINQKKSRIYSFPLKKSSPLIDNSLKEAKIGVIGLSTIQTPSKTSGFIEHLFPETYQFKQYKDLVIKEAKQLQEQGAHAIVLLTHVGNDCDGNSDYGVWTPRNQGEIPCDMKDQMFKLLDQLPQGLVDAVVQGHRHTISHYFYKGVPIIGTTNGGFYVNKIDLKFEIDGSEVRILKQDLSIQGPIPVCKRIFENTQKCEYVAPQNLAQAGQLINWSLHGQPIYGDPVLNKTYEDKYSEKMEKYRFEIANNFIPYPLVKDYAQNSSLGNLITNVMAKGLVKDSTVEIDFLLLNGGGFRTTWYPGVIRYGQLHSMFPFENQIVKFEIKGAQLKRVMEILQNGQKKFYPSWGLVQAFSQNDQGYLTLESLKIVNADDQVKLVQDQKTYVGYTLGFLAKGGDDFKRVLAEGIEIQIKETYPTQMKQFIMEQLISMKEIDEEDMANPGGLERITINNRNSQGKNIEQI